MFVGFSIIMFSYIPLIPIPFWFLLYQKKIIYCIIKWKCFFIKLIRIKMIRTWSKRAIVYMRKLFVSSSKICFSTTIYCTYMQMCIAIFIRAEKERIYIFCHCLRCIYNLCSIPISICVCWHIITSFKSILLFFNY